MKGVSLFILCALFFTLLTSEQGCQDKSATKSGSTTQTTGARTTSHSNRVPINGGLALMVVVGVGLGTYAIVKKKYRKATASSYPRFMD